MLPLLRIRVFFFCFIPFLICQGLFLFCLFPFLCSILFFHFFSLQKCSSLSLSLICTSLLPLLMSCFSPGLPQFLSFSAFSSLLSSLPSAFRYLIQLYRHLPAALPANQPTRPWMLSRAACVLQPTKTSQAVRGCFSAPSLSSHLCLEQKPLEIVAGKRNHKITGMFYKKATIFR